MINIETFRQMALSFPGAVELPHFDLVSFRVKKKIFATYHPKANRAMLKLPLVDQSVFCSYDNTVFFPVPGSWGKNGATFVELKKVKKSIFKDALTIAYTLVANKK
jgi:YjbR protein